ncbi:YbhB/YbcL family Raf kinase inhibitor-like protein [Pseudonocardia lutea]|uniref:YbhB/YbcL family Raf kinase inhibitor-like protein n=1 Tax=Pseudonocardia lutea TaxID=2172015 RepID=A0ABW1IHF7_9PSEU
MIGRSLRGARAGTRYSTWSVPAFAGAKTLVVTSTNFEDGCPLPRPHAGKGVGDDVSPSLHWTAPPTGTAQLLLVIEDVDVPLPRPLTHTAAVLPPHRDSLDIGELRPGAPQVRFLRTVLGQGYHGPTPLRGHGPHHYEFVLHALDAPVPEGVRTFRALRAWIPGHVLARGRIVGTYEL